MTDNKNKDDKTEKGNIIRGTGNIIKGTGNINVSGSQVGVIGDNAEVKGGIHFHSNRRKIDISLEGDDANHRTTDSFYRWINGEEIEGLNIEKSRQDKPNYEIEPSVLSVIASANSIIPLIKAIHTWLRAREPNVCVKLNTKDTELKIDSKNLENLRDLINKASFF